MNNLNLKQMGVQEMNAVEMKETDGGWLGLALGAIALAIYAYDNRDSFMAGYNDAMQQ